MDFSKQMDDILTSKHKIKGVSDLSDEDLICHMLCAGVDDHSFFQFFDMDVLRSRVPEKTPYTLTILVQEAIKRSKLKSAGSAALASRLAKCSVAALNNSELVLQVEEKNETLKIIRGTVKIDAELTQSKIAQRNEKDTLTHAFGALVQLWKPERDKVSGKYRPVITDNSGDIYPRPTIELPDFITNVYDTAKAPTDIPVRLANLIAGVKSDADKVKMLLIVPKMLESVDGSTATSSLTAAFSPPTEQSIRLCKSVGFDGTSFNIMGYSPFPKVSGYTYESAYNYMMKSRTIRGSDQKGLAFNTASYYYGDIPAQWYRPLSIAHNFVSFFRAVSQIERFSDYNLYLDNTFSTFVSASELILLNMPAYSIKQPPFSVGAKYRNGHGHHNLTRGLKVIIPIYFSRDVALKKGKLSFTGDYESMMDSVSMHMKTYDQMISNYELDAVFVVFTTKICIDVLTKHLFVSSVHAHNGSGWFFPKITQKEATIAPEKQISVFSQRLGISNAFKNYYPFHRVPLMKSEPNFHLILKDGAVKTPVMLESLIISCDESNVEAGAIDYDGFYRALEDAKAAIASQREKIGPLPIDDLFNIHFNAIEEEVEVEDEVLPRSSVTSALTGNTDSDL